jgi:uncharacterized membrane protein YhhN
MRVSGIATAATAGGVLFMVSDSLLAVHRFTDFELPCHEGLVMITYTAAQALLSAGATVSPEYGMSD